MKTAIITLITLATTTFNIATTNAADLKPANSNNAVVSVAVNNINKIEASGNVEVYIVNGNRDQVKVFDKYYSKNALVQGKDGVLRISSYAKDKLVVLVTVADLRAITADDNAIIKSDGKLSVIDLNVVLNNNASAKLNIDALAASFTVNNRATVDLKGSIEDYTMNHSQASTINKTELVAQNVTEKNTTTEAARLAAARNVASL